MGGAGRTESGLELEPGTVVASRYRISRSIGRGGMGEVFAAENIRTGRPVAVKLLRADSKTKSSAVARFRREARAAGSINSDHVTQVLDVEDDPEHGIVIVFELLEGESLIDRLKRTGPISFTELYPIIEQVWIGLADAHKVGIIHRDLKPSNVFLERRPDGTTRVKILDFGISKLPKEMGGETLTEMGQSLGTFSFMPPEQIGRAKTVDHRADIYATTTMIFQSLSGQLPYVARNILVMVEMKSKSDPRILSDALGVTVDAKLEAFVAKGLARNPADRFQSALDALAAWRELAEINVPESRRFSPMLVTPASGLPQISGIRSAASSRQAPSSSPASGGSASPSASFLALTPPSSGAPRSPPQPVVPAGMLDPVLPVRLPRIHEPTESTEDDSEPPVILDAAKPTSPQENTKGTLPSMDVINGIPDLAPNERRGPQGTRVMPQSVVAQAQAFAAARNAAKQEALAQGGAAGPAPLPTPPAPPLTPLPHSAVAPSHPSSSARSTSPSLQSPAANHSPSGSFHSLATPAEAAARADAASDRPLPDRGPASPMPGQMQAASRTPSISPSPLLTARLDPDPQHRAPSEEVGVDAGANDRTQVYRPTRNKVGPRKPSIAIYVFGAIAFAVVGFGIVYVVQLLVRSFNAAP